MDPYIWQPVQWYSDASFVLVMQVKDNARSVSGGCSSQHQWEGCLLVHLLPVIYLFIHKMHPVKNPLVHCISYWILLLSMMLKLWDINLSFCSWEDIGSTFLGIINMQEYLFSLTIACTMKHFVGVMKTYILVIF